MESCEGNGPRLSICKLLESIEASNAIREWPFESINSISSCFVSIL